MVHICVDAEVTNYESHISSLQFVLSESVVCIMKF